ncbi:MAG: hypothetical protein ACI8W7_004391, partial [Gammaproteobacteria bacterium]
MMQTLSQAGQSKLPRPLAGRYTYPSASTFKAANSVGTS